MPADACPYRKPFPTGFDECPAFTPQTYVAFDLHYQPTSAVNSCSHLAIGELPGRLGAYYPRCGLGTRAQRVSWVRQVSADRLAGLRELSAEYRAWSRSRMGPLWELKGRMLAARHRGDLAEARHRTGSFSRALAPPSSPTDPPLADLVRTRNRDASGMGAPIVEAIRAGDADRAD